MNKKIAASAFLVFMCIAAMVIPFVIVNGQNTTFGVSIIRVTPASEANALTSVESVYNGTAGELYNIQAELYTSYGTYNVIMGNTIVASGTADQYYVNTNFTIPQLPGGDYNFLIEDVKQGNLNSTGNTPEEFLILPGYSITPTSAYNLEGSNVTLNVQLTGGSAGLPYTANVTVVLPSPLNGNFSDMVAMTTNSVGTANAQIIFPSSSFQPGDSLQLGGLSPTDFAGNYTVYFNMTEALGQNQFTVGFLDKATYHRTQTATVTAAGYSAGQTATLTVTNVATGSSMISSQQVTADSNGAITTTFTIPESAAVGNYKAVITTTSGNSKLLQDVQEFSISGYPVTITTLNLAGQIVPSILVLVQDQSANTSYNATSDSNGNTNFNLENGPYALTASWNGVQVGATNITVNGAGSFNLQCSLTDLQITVVNENGTTLPFVNLAISFKYGSSQATANYTGQTNPSGMFTLNSTLSGVAYTIQASIYGQVFNSGNDTISSLPAQAVYQLTIICPTETTTFNIVGYNNDPIPDANIQLIELTNGLFYTTTTDSSGSASAPLTFGVYKVQIYQNGILLNQTTYHAFSEGQDNIRCTLYGIQVSVQVVDYFGHPISNANVTVNGPSSERFSAVTSGNGKATFNNVVGGNMQIVAFASGAENSYQALSLTVDQPMSVQIKMAGYVAFGSMLVPTSAVITLILVIIAVVLLVVVELFLLRRRRHATES